MTNSKYDDSFCALRTVLNGLKSDFAKFDQSIKRVKELSCGICLGPIRSSKVEGPLFGIQENCPHIFCVECLLKWYEASRAVARLANSCPICRTKSEHISAVAQLPSSIEEKARHFKLQKRLYTVFRKNAENSESKVSRQANQPEIGDDPEAEQYQHEVTGIMYKIILLFIVIIGLIRCCLYLLGKF